MAQQRPDSFVPDDGPSDSFVADSFVPDKEELQFETVEVRPGQFMSVRKGETPFEALKRVEDRPDTGLFRIGERGAPERGFDSITQGITNRIATSNWIPESLKRPLAMLASAHTEPFRLATDILANPQPEDILVPSVVKPSSLSRTFKAPPVKPPSMRINLAEPKNITIRPPIEREVIIQYPPMQPMQKAEDTALAAAMRMNENPELVMYPRDELTGFAKYAAADESIQADIAAVKARGDERFRRFMEPSPGPGQEIPASPYSTRMGFDEAIEGVPEGPDAQLYWTVPQRLYPRRVQSGLEAIAPEKVKVPPHTLEAEGIPQIDVLPRAEGKPIARTTGPLAKGGITTTIRTGSRGYYGYEDRLDNYVKNNITPAIPDAAEVIKPIIDKPKGILRILADHLFVSSEKQLAKMGPIGQEIRKVLSNTEYTKRELFNKFADPYLQAIAKVPEAERENLVLTLDGQAQALTPAVAEAVKIIRKVTDDIATMAADAGVRVKLPDGSIAKFKGLEHYWPHLPVNPIDQATFVEELLKRNPKLTRTQAEKLAQNFINESEFFHSPQHSRAEGADFEWRKDLAAMTDHIAGMSDIIARAQKLGAGDIGVPGTIIDNLIEQTPDRVKARELVRTHLRGGMDRNNEFYRTLKKVNNAATKFQVFTKLGMFPISNLNNQLQTMLYGNLAEFGKSLVKTMVGSPELKALTKEYGTVSVGNVPAGILAEAGKRPIPVVGGLVKWSDDWARTVATGTGQGTAKMLFQAAKDGSPTAIRKMKNLLLEDNIDDILKQSTLNPDQLKFATQRFVELSQQLASNMKLPPAWVNEPILHIPLIFKQFAYQGTKATWDAIMQDPVRNIPLFLLAAPMFGELTGDLKAAVYGAVRGFPMPDETIDAIGFELANRHKFVEKITGADSDESDAEWLTNRIVADYVQSWGLGLTADMLQGLVGGPYAGYTALFGPMIDDVVTGLTGTYKAGRDVLGGLENTSGLQGMGREGLRSIPVVGPGLQRRLLPYESQEMPE